MRRFLCAILILVAAVLSATTYYIDTGGDDGTGDGSSGSPWESLSHACSQATTPGDIIHINAGTYADDTSQCTLALGVSIEGAGKATTKIVTSRQGSITVDSSPGSGGGYIHAVTDRTGQTGCAENASTNTISGFELDGSSRSCYVGIVFSGRNNVIVHDMTFTDIRDIALIQEGWNYDYGAWADPTNTAPPYWGTGHQIYNVTLDNCSRHVAGSPTWAIEIDQLQGALIHDITADFSADSLTGCVIGSRYRGWLDSVEIYDSTLYVYGANGDSFCLELFNFQNGSKIYNNQFNSFVSIVRNGPVAKVGGTWHLEIYDNTWTMDSGVASGKMGLELAHRWVRVYRNYIDGNGVGGRIQMGVDSNAIANNNTDDTSGVQIDNNVMYDIVWWPIKIQTIDGLAIDNVGVYHNTLDGGTQPGIALNHGGVAITNVAIKNNVVVNGYQAIDLNSAPSATVVCAGNYMDGNSSGDTVANQGSATVANNVDADPELTASGDRPSPYYAPASGSSAIVDDTTNSQDVSVYLSVDYLGNARTGTFDIGALEYGAEPPVTGGILFGGL